MSSTLPRLLAQSFRPVLSPGCLWSSPEAGSVLPSTVEQLPWWPFQVSAPGQIQAETPQEGQGNLYTAQTDPIPASTEATEQSLRDSGRCFLCLGQHDEALQG